MDHLIGLLLTAGAALTTGLQYLFPIGRICPKRPRPLGQAAPMGRIGFPDVLCSNHAGTRGGIGPSAARNVAHSRAVLRVRLPRPHFLLPIVPISGVLPILAYLISDLGTTGRVRCIHGLHLRYKVRAIGRVLPQAALPFRKLGALFRRQAEAQVRPGLGYAIVAAVNCVEGVNPVLFALDQLLTGALFEDGKRKGSLTMLIPGVLQVAVGMRACAQMVAMDPPPPWNIDGAADVLLTVDYVHDGIDTTLHTMSIPVGR